MEQDQRQQTEKQLVETIDKYLDKNPYDAEVMETLKKHAVDAAEVLATLLYTGSDATKLSAAKDILDRSGYKPIERKDVTSGGQPISQPYLTDEQLMDVINGFLKRNAIDVPGTEVRSIEGTVSEGS